MDLADLTATAARARIQAGQLTPAELMEACLARVAEREPVLRALAYLDPALARASAAAARPGPLHGLPLGVKDVLDTADMPAEYNSPIWRGNRPRADAAAVAWARAAGAAVLGKTVTTEFATRFPGPTANPHNPAHTPGGSSSGSAAGVAAGYFPFAYGTQTAGSVIRPAAYCGIVGYKPSYGTIERHGMKLMSFSLDTVGVLARTVADCALLVGAVRARTWATRSARYPPAFESVCVVRPRGRRPTRPRATCSWTPANGCGAPGRRSPNLSFRPSLQRSRTPTNLSCKARAPGRWDGRCCCTGTR